MPAVRPAEPVDEEPARAAEWIGRMIIAASLAALLFALWSPRLESAASWEKEVRSLPRLSVFVVAALCALVIQGARPSRTILATLGLLALIGAIWMLPTYTSADRLSPAARLAYGFTTPEGVRPAAPETPSGQLLIAGPCVTLLRFEFSLLAALLLGTWLGRDIKTGTHFLALLLCAVVGDAWFLSRCRAAESVDATHVLNLLRLPWPPPLAFFSASPAFTDVLVVSAALEAARRLKFHTLSVVLGAVAGYAAASFLALEPTPAWTSLGMIMVSIGMLAGCWPDLHLDSTEIGKVLLVSAVLMLALVMLTMLHIKLHPAPESPVDLARYQNAT